MLLLWLNADRTSSNIQRVAVAAVRVATFFFSAAVIMIWNERIDTEKKCVTWIYCYVRKALYAYYFFVSSGCGVKIKLKFQFSVMFKRRTQLIEFIRVVKFCFVQFTLLAYLNCKIAPKKLYNIDDSTELEHSHKSAFPFYRSQSPYSVLCGHDIRWLRPLSPIIGSTKGTMTGWMGPWNIHAAADSGSPSTPM